GDAGQQLGLRGERLEIGRWQCLGSGDGVVACAAVQEVVAQTTEDNIVSVERTEERVLRAHVRTRWIKVEWRQISRLLQLARDIYGGLLDLARGADELVEGLAGWHRWDAVERFGCAVPAGHQATVITEHSVGASAPGNPVIAITAEDIVVL